MIYPIILSLLGIGMLVFFMSFVLPEILDIIIDSGQELPLITITVLKSVEIIKQYGINSVLSIAGSFIFIKILIPKEKFKRISDAIFLKIPLISDVIRSVVTSRFLRTMSLMLKRGIPLVEILDTVERTLGNSIASDAIRKCKEGILKGESLSSNLNSVHFFDPIVVELIGIGEETGQLDNILNTLSQNSEKDAEQKIARLVSAIEPLFTIVIGVTIAVLVLAMLLPMFNMISGFKTE
jgi:type IV pilus assembly protein PilC